MRDELDVLVRQMVDGGILYREALTQFKRVFILVVLRDNAENKSKTARILGMHRNTFARNLADLGIKVEPRPPQKATAVRGSTRRAG